MTDRYDLFDDVIAKLRFEPLSRQEQHAQLERIVAAEREACAIEVEQSDPWYGDYFAAKLRNLSVFPNQHPKC